MNDRIESFIRKLNSLIRLSDLFICDILFSNDPNSLLDYFVFSASIRYRFILFNDGLSYLKVLIYLCHVVRYLDIFGPIFKSDNYN